MIQRLQTLFLFLSALISGLMLVVPVYEFAATGTANAEGAAPVLTTFVISGNALLMIVNAAIGVLSFLAVFLYKNRNLQIRLCNLGMLLTCVLIGLLFFLADTMSSNLDQHVQYKYGSYLPLIQLVFLFLAGKFIRRDEDLVRSADRLR